ncbi:GNAT family N-acetyltransferase [Serinicoccus marinus]|uniref:GNAT family N-acetyltransferase n=1 Tax=Serinicoccus marinus TaxID=247333 RepID=UPI0024908127|nr:GNAT family protein [Serinicoccus marinus]
MTDDPGAEAYRLRAVRDGDAAAVLEAFRSAPDMARQGEVSDLGSARGYVTWLQAEGRRGYAVTCADRLVGVVGVIVDEVNRTGWVFYWMHAGHRGRRVMGRAVATVCDRLLADGLERLELGHRVDNPASGGVARAAGFLPEGRERGKFLIDGERVDVLTYGRLRSDPASRHAPLEVEVQPDVAGIHSLL